MLYVHGLGHFHPENEIDNAFLESLDIGTNEAWITSRVGIKNRRTVLPLDYIKRTKNQDLRAAQEARLYTNAETGRRAALMAIERAGLQPKDIGMVIAGGCSPDNCIPAESSSIAKALGIEVPAIDFSSACSTFGAQLHFVERLGATMPDWVLCVVPENTTRITDFSDRSSAILFGDATAAAVVSTKNPSKVKAVFSSFGGAPSGADEVVIPRVGHFYQNGAAVQKFAIKKMSELLRQIQERVPAERQNRVIYVGHQANLTMLEAVVRRCEIPEARHYFNIVEYGNQAAAGAPVVLSQRWADFKPGDIVACVVVGSGLSWSSLQLEWA
ncbi:MAG: ketoacyl-ACP synthase III [Polyangiaceae bacterium]|nr:ketoacyl-ACP synthase III [Polyangiaceae bacterium]